MITPVPLPQLELTMESALVVNVLVKEGDHVAAGQALIEVETQKATSEVPSPAAGFVRALKVKAGDELGANALICLLATTVDEPLDGALANDPTVSTPMPTAPASTATAPTPDEPASPHLIKAAPAARKAARDLNVDLSLVKATGPHGRTTVEDVQAYASTRTHAKTAPAPTTPLADAWEELPAARLALIAQMQKSLAEIPQIVVTRQLDVTPLSQKLEGITFTHRLIAKLAAALGAHPALRTVTDGQRVKTSPVSVAVAMDTPTGLVAPVLRGADLGLVEAIAKRVANFRERAGRRALKNDELKDGPFAVTNLGMLGVDFFTPFVFHGQTAVLAVGRTTDGDAGRKVAWFSLAADHRVVDGAEAARFLATLQTQILS